MLCEAGYHIFLFSAAQWRVALAGYCVVNASTEEWSADENPFCGSIFNSLRMKAFCKRRSRAGKRGIKQISCSKLQSPSWFYCCSLPAQGNLSGYNRRWCAPQLWGSGGEKVISEQKVVPPKSTREYKLWISRQRIFRMWIRMDKLKQYIPLEKSLPAA